MSDKSSLAQQVLLLNANVTALTMVVESLLVSELERDDDPGTIAEAMVKDVFSTDAKMRKLHGEHEVSLYVSEALTSLIDRAAQRALARKSKEGRSR